VSPQRLSFLLCLTAEGAYLPHQVSGASCRRDHFIQVGSSQAAFGHIVTGQLGKPDDAKSMLLESWAIPPASVSIASIFSAPSGAEFQVLPLSPRPDCPRIPHSQGTGDLMPPFGGVRVLWEDFGDGRDYPP